MTIRCLITGGSGFVGRRLAATLIARGIDVAITTRRPYCCKDIQSIVWPEVALPAPEVDGYFDAIFHLAALTDLSECNTHPDRANAVNALGACHAVELAHRVAGRLIYISTLGVYGNPQYLPIDEDHPTIPIEAYSTSKLKGEQITIERATMLGVSWAIVRSFNVYGPGQTGDWIVPSIVKQALKSTTIALKENVSSRDFIFVDDLCGALLAVADSGAKGIFNAGTGIETSVSGLVRIVGEVLGRSLDIATRGNSTYPVVARSMANIEKIQRVTGWRPLTTLHEGLQRTIAFYSQNPKDDQ